MFRVVSLLGLAWLLTGCFGEIEDFDNWCSQRPDAMPCTDCSIDEDDPAHMAVDTLALWGSSFFVEGKFAYGLTSSDLEGYLVDLWITDGECGMWTYVGSSTTNSDGRASFQITADMAGGEVSNSGQTRFAWTVRGDNSYVEGSIFVIAPTRPVVIFDVDGTLTTADSELIDEFVLDDDAQPMDAAVDVVNYWSNERGAQIVYITGRHYTMHHRTKEWLFNKGFPPGPLYSTRSWDDSLPGESGVGQYKQALFEELINKGVNVIRGYGNAQTDTCAYRRAGLAEDQVLIVDQTNIECEPGVMGTYVSDYASHLAALQN